MTLKLKDISFSDEKTNSFYKKMWGTNEFEIDVLQKNTACEFTTIENSIEKTLIKIFGITQKEFFKSKLEQAISGDGSEDNKILNMRSSSLCSLLFFYNVTKKNPLYIVLNGEPCRFETSIFEFKNKVIRNPSNMDVVLLGYKINNKNKKVILFLESKFAEYYFGVIKPENKYWVRYSYYKNYQSLYEKVVNKLGYFSSFEEIKKTDGEYFEIVAKENRSYIEGIKQMISHYIGVQNFARGDYSSKLYDNRFQNISEFLKIEYAEKTLLDQLRKNAEIYLGEIVFDGPFSQTLIENDKTYLSDYEEKHEQLADILAEENKNESVHIVKGLLHYSDYKDWNHKIENNIIKYYFGNI